MLSAIAGLGVVGGAAAATGGESRPDANPDDRGRTPPPALLWEQRFPESDRGPGTVVVGNDGGYVFADAARSEADATLRGARVVRTDPFGNVAWQQTYGSEEDSAYDVTSRNSGGYLFAGETTAGAGDSSGWLVAIDDDGGTEWAQSFDGSRAKTVVQRDRGRILVAGTATDGVWAALTDVRGGILWDRTYRAITANAAAVDREAFVVAGERWDGGRNAWLARIRTDGELDWTRTYGDGTEDGATSVLPVDDGFVLAGSRTPAGSDSSRAWVARVDSVGALQNEVLVGDGETAALDLVDLETEGFLAVGRTTAGDEVRAWMARLTPDLGVEWEASYGSASIQTARSALALPDGQFLVVGQAGTGGWMGKLGPARETPTATPTATTTMDPTTTPTTTGPATTPTTTRTPTSGPGGPTTTSPGTTPPNGTTPGESGGGLLEGIPLKTIGAGAGGLVVLAGAGAAGYYLYDRRDRRKAKIKRPSEVEGPAEASDFIDDESGSDPGDDGGSDGPDGGDDPDGDDPGDSGPGPGGSSDPGG